MDRTAIILLLIVLVAPASARDRTKINEPFDNKPNPFLQVLGLDPYRISLSRDSTRIALKGGGHVDMILERKRLQRFRQYDAKDRPMDSGDLSMGTGRVRFLNGMSTYEATFLDGLLHGPMTRSDFRNGEWVPMLSAGFRNGLLQGELSHRSLWSPQYVSNVQHYNNGIIWMSESYGRRNWWWGFLWFLVPRERDTDKVCSRTIYVDGRPQLHSCLLSRKCRSCGI